MNSQAPREVPYNYSSAEDKQVFYFILGDGAWDSFERLRDKRVTGRSARLLLRVIGEFFLLRRNPYIYEELLDSLPARRRFAGQVAHDLDLVKSKASGNEDVLSLVGSCRRAFDDIIESLRRAHALRAKTRAALGAIVGQDNVRFDPLSLISHATDATDWRLFLPFVVVTPTREDDIGPLLAGIQALGLKAIARGAGTGLTGGAVPLAADVAIVNTERLDRVIGMGEMELGGKKIQYLDAEAGCVTETAIHAAEKAGWVFATDPTSAWACTIGGNIAENAGGKTAVLWGTTVDNLLSWRMALPDGSPVVVERLEHPGRKILPDDILRFALRGGGGATIRTFELKGSELRKQGLWKDITNKALGGLPGLQKEGTDGVITGARFILHRPYERKTTICLEFFGDDMEEASRVILALVAAFENGGEETLMALEHFDDEYVEAIGYQTRASRGGRPKAVLLIDLVAHDDDQLARGLASFKAIVAAHASTEAFYARDRGEAEAFWAARKNLGAIARHTNAFKLNEDVVLPLPRLAEFAAHVEAFNLDEERHNQRAIAGALREAIQKEGGSDPALVAKLAAAESLFEDFERELGSSDRASLRASLPASRLRDALLGRFAGNPTLEGSLPLVFKAERIRLIKVATHMHAGDGNVHCNIPVFSNDRLMLARANEAAETVMREAVDLGGVVSGEHGIGLTKLRFLDAGRIADLEAHRARLDPRRLMSPGALIDPGILERVFTPSFNLLGLEARILQHDQLAVLAAKIQNCVRCGKCKPDCCVNVPERGMFYNPRNKNLAIASIIEALLYDAQRSRSASFDILKRLEEIGDHCTVCHKCRKPCPVDIDTGEVSILERQILKARGFKHTSAATGASLAYLEKGDDPLFQGGFRFFVLGAGMRAQRLASAALRGLPREGKLRHRFPVSLLSRPIPLSRGKPLFKALSSSGARQAVFIKPADFKGKTVFYFPGCGSERLHGIVARSSVYILLKAGVQVLLPPPGLCCGYPFGVNGRRDAQKAIELRDTIIFGQIGEMFSYLDFDAVLVSCGTCEESLRAMEAGRFFNAPLRDLSAFALESGLAVDGLGEVLYHKPCHDSLDGAGPGLIAGAGGKAIVTAHCCGEAGTLALSRPDIGVDLHDRKEAAILAAKVAHPASSTLVTNCPSCLQGLGRHEGLGVEAMHLTELLARKSGGPDWEGEFETMVKAAETVTF